MFAVLSAYIAKDSIFVNFGGLEMKIMHLFSLSSFFFSLSTTSWIFRGCKMSAKIMQNFSKTCFVCVWLSETT